MDDGEQFSCMFTSHIFVIKKLHIFVIFLDIGPIMPTIIDTQADTVYSIMLAQRTG